MKNNRVLTTAHSFVWRIQSPRLSNTQRLLVILFLHPTPQAKRGLLALIKSSFTLWQYYCTRAHHQLSFLAPVYLRCYCDVTGNPSSSRSSTFSNSYRVQGRKEKAKVLNISSSPWLFGPSSYTQHGVQEEGQIQYYHFIPAELRASRRSIPHIFPFVR